MSFFYIRTVTYYNPITNKLLTNENEYLSRTDFVCIGHRKIAEAFITVKPEERPAIWNAFDNETYGIDLSKLNSKLRHKMKKIGLYQLPKKGLCKGLTLLNKINAKK